jgi:hypothetical protein
MRNWLLAPAQNMPRPTRRVIAAGPARCFFRPKEGIPMPGRHLTDHQVRLYMKFRANRYPPTAAAAKAGFRTASARSARIPGQLRDAPDPY